MQFNKYLLMQITIDKIYWSSFPSVQLDRMVYFLISVQYKSKETPQLIGLFSPNLVITNFMQCFLYGPIG